MNNQMQYMGWAVVAENNQPSDPYIMVALLEQHPNMDGDLEANPQRFHSQGVDAYGRPYLIAQKTDSVVTALWWNEHPNRLIAPQVQKGERVVVYRFDGEDQYYWKPLNMNMHKRVQEVSVEYYAARKKDQNGPLDIATPYNSYTRTVDGINGYMEERTSKENHEACIWVRQAHGAKGFYLISDEEGNYFKIDHNGTCITLENADGSKVVLDRKTIDIYAPDTINIKAGNTINMEAREINVKCDTYNKEAKEINMKCDTYNKEATQIKISGENVSWKANEFTLDCPTINLDGVVNAGAINTTGAGGASGNVSVKGNTDVSGTMSVTGPVSLNGGTSNGVIQGSYIDT